MASRIAGGGSRTLYAEDARRDAERRYGPGAYYEAGNGGGRSSGQWYDGVVSAFHGAMNWIGDLTGFDNGSFSLGNIGLSGSNAAAANEAWDGVITVTAPARQAVDDFFGAWSIPLPRQRVGETSVSAYSPPSNPIAMLSADIGFRSGLVRDMYGRANGIDGMRSVFNSDATNFGLSTRAFLERAHATFAAPFAGPYGALDTAVGRPLGAVGLHWNSSSNLTGTMAAEPTIGVASIFVANPEAIAATMGPRAVVVGGSPEALVAGRLAEPGILQALGSSGKVSFQPTPAQANSAAFRVIVGEPEYTAGGQLVGTVYDGAIGNGVLAEIKTGQSVLSSSYQLRLQTYGALVNDTPFSIYTSRPLNNTFNDWLVRWGVDVKPLPPG